MKTKIEHQDVLEWADKYDGSPFHALICDPPYELGFMGKKWDNSGIAFSSNTWVSITKHLHPGGFGMAFASTRGFHRMAVAIEDAGLTIHPVIMVWGFGSGFPKATRIKDKKEWEGHRYGLQALKPSLEPIVVFQKPYDGKPVDSIARTGAGAWNVDGGRVGRNVDDVSGWSQTGSIASENKAMSGGNYPRKPKPDASGRWPANLVLSYPEDRKDEVVGVFPQQASGANPTRRNAAKSQNAYGIFAGQEKCVAARGSESGSAARFFFNAVHEQIDEADPLFYCPKASRRERDAGLGDLPLRRKVFNGKSDHSAGMAEGSVEDKFTTQPGRNIHPTVKPMNLIKYLSTLLLPPTEYAPRRIMVPFAGSGSEMIGAMLAGWEEVLGIEREGEYADIAQRRVEFWGQKRSTLF